MPVPAASKVVSQPDGAIEPPVWRTNRPEGLGAPASRPVRSSASLDAPAEPSRSQAEFEVQVQQQLQLAFEAGAREGESAARQKLEAEVRRAVEQLAVSAAEVAATRADALRRAEADVVQLSIEIARRVLHRELSVDPAALGALVRAALEKLATQRVCRVRVHSDQEQIVRATLAQLGRGSEIEVVTDSTQPRGSALFETENSSLDASIDTQLREIERGLADRLQERV